MNHMFLVKHLSCFCHVVFPLPLVLHGQTSFVDNDCGIACQAVMFVFLVNICKAHIMCASRTCAVESPIKEEVFFSIIIGDLAPCQCFLFVYKSDKFCLVNICLHYGISFVSMLKLRAFTPSSLLHNGCKF